MHEIRRAETDQTLPEAVDVAIIGGGIIGATTALYLAQKGISAALFDKGLIGGEQSSRNWGWVRKMGRDPREVPLAIHGLDLWGKLNAETGEETGFRIKGITYFAETDVSMAGYLRWLDAVKEFGLDTRPITSDELNVLVPGLARKFSGGLHTSSDGMAEPALATAAVIAGARKLGAKAYEFCAVRGIETSVGRVSAVVTERGTVKCQSVLLAGGGWSSFFAGSLGLRLPQLRFQANVMRSAPIEGGPEGCGSGPGFGFRKRLDGGYNVSMRSNHPVDIVPDSFRFYFDFKAALKAERKAMKLRIGRRSFEELTFPRKWRLDRQTFFERYRVADPEPSHDILDAARENIVKLLPTLKDIRFIERIGGYVDSTPDALPVISPVEQIPGFYIGTGFSGHGLGVGPAAGHMLANLIAGEKPVVDPSTYRFSRFSDGTKIENWPIGF